MTPKDIHTTLSDVAMAAGHAGSDYGSEFGDDAETELRDLLDDIELQRASQSLLSPFVQGPSQGADALSVVPGLSVTGSMLPDIDDEDYGWHDSPVEVLEDDAGMVVLPMEIWRDEGEDRVAQYQADHKFGLEEAKEDPNDTRSPLERFRSRKPLSVSDLVAPAWCELQYWYSLTKYGRKRRTRAMKEGSAVHKKLEEETMGVAEPVETQTKEDGFALRTWNIIQSLRLLRATGTTRELEIWGVVSGQLVNGVIDELSWTCPDTKFEEALSSQFASPSKENSKSAVPEINQPTISQFFASGSQQRRQDRETAKDDGGRKLYLTDVKTRVGTSIPAPASLRPTKMQLMLYRRLLSDLASNNIDAAQVFSRYRLDANAEFTDTFISSMSDIDTNLGPGIPFANFAEIQTPPGTVVELLQHRTLSLLWQLMIQEYALTLPRGGDNISHVLRAQFVGQKDHRVIGDRTFAYDDSALESYVADEMRWWTGERAAKGVEIEEAFKCGICEFAEGCDWRHGKVDDAVRTSREKRARKKTVG